MRKIGIIGGLSWYSSMDYYRHINEIYQEQSSKTNSAPLILNSLNLETVSTLFKKPNKAIEYLVKEAQILEAAGCEILLIASNTVHSAFTAIEKNTSMQCLHIADSCAEKLKQDNIKKIALLGTKYSLEKDFITKRLKQHNLEVLIPSKADIKTMQRYIETELTLGIFSEKARDFFIKVIEDFKSQGAQAAIMACTEIPILLKNTKIDLALIDSSLEHCKDAVFKALKT